MFTSRDQSRAGSDMLLCLASWLAGYGCSHSWHPKNQTFIDASTTVSIAGFVILLFGDGSQLWTPFGYRVLHFSIAAWLKTISVSNDAPVKHAGVTRYHIFVTFRLSFSHFLIVGFHEIGRFFSQSTTLPPCEELTMTALVSISSALMHIVFRLQFAATVFIGLLLLRLLSNRLKSGLSSIPGPTLAKYTRLWRLYDAWAGQSHFVSIRLHRKYGDVVRIGPKHLIFSHPTAIADIYGLTKTFPKVRCHS